jgi:FkbM family methyltransferase
MSSQRAMSAVPLHKRAIAVLPHLPARFAELVPPADERGGTSPAVGAARGIAAAVRQLRGRSDAIVTLDGGARVRVDLDTSHGRRLYAYGFCEPAARALRGLATPGGVVLDGGANIGLFTVLAATLVGRAGLVVACEPAPATMALLRENVARNALEHVTLREAALADAPGLLTLRVFDPGSGYSSFAPADAAGAHEVEVAVTTLDELAGDLLDRVTLVKLDVEGAELRALRGASALLSRARPDFIVELEDAHLARQGSAIADVQSLFEDAGYDAFAIAGDRFERMTGTWRPPARDPNIVVRPRERG